MRFSSWNTPTTPATSLALIKQEAAADKLNSVERVYRNADLRFVESRNNVTLISPKGEAQLSYHAFAQFCNEVSAPAGVLTRLSAKTAANALNELRAKSLDADATRKLLVRRIDNDAPIIRMASSESYERLWDIDAINMAEAQGLTIARISRSERALSFHATRPGVEDVELGMRAAIAYHGSEVYFMRVALMMEAFVLACTNGLMTMKELFSAKRRHVGNVSGWVDAQFDVMRSDMGDGSRFLREIVQRSAGHALGLWRDEEKLISQTSSLLGLPQSHILASLPFAKRYSNESFASALAIAQGLTEYAQTLEQTEDMMRVEVAAAKLLDAVPVRNAA